MTRHGHIPRPRHLFPEAAAVVIQTRRGLFLGTRSIRRVVGKVSPWTAGAACGLCGMMLAVLLFFLSEPVIHAAPSPTIASPLPEPAMEPIFPGTYAPPAEMTLEPTQHSRLFLQMLRTRLPLSWDQKQVVTRVSQPNPPVLSRFTPSFSDLWRQSFQRSAPQVPGPYTGLGLNVISGLAAVASSNQPPVLERILSHRGLGVVLEKFVPSMVVAEVPFQYEIRVTNVTREAIESLLLSETISEHHRVINAQPESHVEAGKLHWNVTNLGAGEVRRFLVTMVPLQKIDIATQTRLTSITRVAAGNLVTEPAPPEPMPEPLLPIFHPAPPVPVAPPAPPMVEVPPPKPEPGFPILKLTVSPPERLKTGENLSVVFTVENVGTADATNVTLFVRLSGEFEHRYGEFVKHPIAVLKPGQRHRALLQAVARNEGNAKLDANLTMQDAIADNRLWTIPIQRPVEQISNRSVTPRQPPALSQPPVPSRLSRQIPWYDELREVSLQGNCFFF